MGTNLSIESPSFEKVTKEAGPFTSNAINILWQAANDTRAVERRDFRRASETLAPALLEISAAASVDNQNLNSASAVSFTGASAQNLTGFKAPETGECRLLFVQVRGAGTITVKHNVTSETANRIITSTGADVSLTTGKGMVLMYAGSNWRQVV